jgi:uncharacterized protein (DUF885 family)
LELVNTINKTLAVCLLSIGSIHASATPLALGEGGLSEGQDSSRVLKSLVSDYWEAYLYNNPQDATALGDKRYNDRLGDLSKDARSRALHQSQEFARRLDAISATSLSREEQLSADLLRRAVIEYQESAPFKEWEMPVNQILGAHIDFPQLIAATPFDDQSDYENYIHRLRRLPRLFRQLTENMRQGILDKRVQPNVVSAKVLAQVDAVISIGHDQSPFIAPVKRFPDPMPPRIRARIVKALDQALANEVIPAYRRFAEFLRNEYIPHGRKEPGVWDIPQGDAYYSFCIRRNTTLEMSADEVHNIGLNEVHRDEMAMLQIAKQLGYDDLKSFSVAMATDPSLHASTKEQVLELYRSALGRMAPKLPQLVGVLPKATLIVEATPAYTEKQRPGATYLPGSVDGKRPGRVVVNTFDYAHIPLVDAEAIAYHEGIPGHHLQFSIAQELQGIPEFRKNREYTAYTEGWGLYAEELGKEVGLYEDPHSDYGRLEGDMLRAIRLVVDTGLHAKHWTRQQVVDFFHEHSSIDETTVQRETDRYIAWPGQALGYKIGQLKLLEFRRRAEAALGSKFDIKRFHDLVLDSGAMPLDILSAQVDQWVASQQ